MAKEAITFDAAPKTVTQDSTTEKIIEDLQRTFNKQNSNR